MKKITDLFATKEKTISMEFFPPRTDKGRENLFKAATALSEISDFFSVTYGAGGSSSKSTFDIVLELQKTLDLPVMHHLTCVRQDWDTVRAKLAEFREAGIHNILALRGDPPQDEPDYAPGLNEPKYGYELVQAIREYGDYFTICVPGFPEGHPLSETLELDSKYLKVKQDAGADFVITQLFFDNDVYYRFRERVQSIGVTMRLIPGILTITNYKSLLDFCDRCGTSVPGFVAEIFEPLADDPEATYKRGVEFAIQQCQELLDNGAPGLHMYCLNKTEPVTTVYNALSI